MMAMMTKPSQHHHYSHAPHLFVLCDDDEMGSGTRGFVKSMGQSGLF
jgi:hypothetical protein